MKLLAHANRSMPFSEHGTFCSPAVRGAPGKGHPDRTIINDVCFFYRTSTDEPSSNNEHLKTYTTSPLSLTLYYDYLHPTVSLWNTC